MKVLLVKLSSLGDVVHTLAALTDLQSACPEVQIDWAVEEGLVDIAEAHPAVNEVIQVAIRRWRNSWVRCRGEIIKLRQRLRSNQYDLVVDAQGLYKSALVSKLASASVYGLDGSSSREPLSRLFYSKTFKVAKSAHAVERTRRLFALIFDYSISSLPLDYGLGKRPLVEQLPVVVTGANPGRPELLFFHGTTWASKHWPEVRWHELIELATTAGYTVQLPHGNDQERDRATALCADFEQAKVLPREGIAGLMRRLRQCAGVVSVDTGLGHLAVALDVPLVGIYGSTNTALTGPYGGRQQLLAGDNLACIPCLKRHCQYTNPPDNNRIYPPCYTDVTAARVFNQLLSLMPEPST
ncbi:MAG: lipopolysaccharide heptosyltransferase I [Pseudomonadales bacterium]|nr:lipopolysaccharide heptosyltransferase I [Pseudomonadales bacterium]